MFRPNKNIQRLNLSNQRLSIPTLDEGLVMEALKQLQARMAPWLRQTDEE